MIPLFTQLSKCVSSPHFQVWRELPSIKDWFELRYSYLYHRIPISNQGCRACSLLLEQRVHHVSDKRQRCRDSTDHVSSIVSKQQESLEQNHPWAHLQRFEAVHGDEPETVRRLHSEIQSWAGRFLSDHATETIKDLKKISLLFIRKRNGRGTASGLKLGKKWNFWPEKIPKLRILVIS